MDNVIINQDGICLAAHTREELRIKTEQVSRWLKQAGMTTNRDKCNIRLWKNIYLGYQIPRGGISPNERLTNKIAKIESTRTRKNWNPLWD